MSDKCMLDRMPRRQDVTQLLHYFGRALMSAATAYAESFSFHLCIAKLKLFSIFRQMQPISTCRLFYNFPFCPRSLDDLRYNTRLCYFEPVIFRESFLTLFAKGAEPNILGLRGN